METYPNNFKKLENLYREVPGVPCIAGCTGCCVSPTITLSEIIYLMQSLYEVFDQTSLIESITKSMKPHPWFEGNFFCRFQKPNGLCGVHEFRALACRLHGLPVLDNLEVSNLENCTIMEKALLPDLPVETVKQWLEKLMECNCELRPGYGENFHQVYGFNIECWLDIIYIDDLSNSELQGLQQILRSHIPYNRFPLNYSPHTEIREKTDAITLLEFILQAQDKDSTIELLEKIQTNYPTTGTYFLEQSQWMLDQIKG